jgi:type I restriction enzyme S subunit
MKCSVISDTEDHISAQAIRESATTLVPRDTLLLVVRSGILRHSIPVALAGCSVTINQDIKALIPRRADTKPQYYAALIHGLQDQLLTLWRKQGATVESLESDLIGDTVVPVPPPAEQRAIADFLDRETAKIDALIAAQERLIALLDEKRQATITHAVTKGLDPNAPMKESGVEWLGKVPRHWGVIPLKRCCRIPNGLVDPTVGRYATLSLIAPNHVQSGTGRLLEVETADDQGAISGKYHFAEGTVLYSKIRPALRKACVAPFEGLCSADMYPIYSTKITPRLLLYQLLSDYFSSFAILSSDRVAMPKVNRETIGDFPMVVPPSAEQEVIVRYVDEAVAEIDRLGDRSVEVIERLRERRTALITAAVTGQIDVTRQAITETAK